MKAFCIGLVLPALLLADFRYEQTTRITKGMVTKMAFGKKPEPTLTTSYFKGSRMANVSKDSKTILDFDKQLFTVVNVEKKEYWQMTFEEMRQAMANLQAEMNDATKGKDVNMNMKFDAKSTGVEKEVGGVNAKQVIFTIETGASDGKSSGTMMKMVSDSWHSESVAGYAEYRAFFERLKDKGGWLNMGNPMAQMGGQPGMVEGMRKMAEEMQKTPGIAVLTITRMTMPGMNFSMSGGGANGANGQPVNAGEAAKEAGGEAVGRKVAGSMGGLVGGALGGRLGGFGRKKKDDAAAQAEAEAAAKQAETTVKQTQKAAEESKTSDGMLMMESFTDTSGFSTASISEEVFAVPAGFAKVEPEMLKRKKR
jgi:hypothetical protein